MIRFGDTKSIPELKNLWKTCFADEDAYIDAFFDALYDDHNVLLEEENGVLMGASFFLPGEICLEHPAAHSQECPDDLQVHRQHTDLQAHRQHTDLQLQACSGIQVQWQEIRYVYALAVYPQFRGQGIAGALLQRAHEIYGAPLIAEPAEEGLVGGFYEPLGFSRAFYLEKKCLEVQQYEVRAAEILPGQGFYQDAAAWQMSEDACACPAKADESEDGCVCSAKADESEDACACPAKADESEDVCVCPAKADESEDVCVCPVKADEYCRIRDVYFQTHGYVRWPAKHVAFAIQEHCGSGGGAYVVRKGGREDLLLYFREGQDIIVTETTLTEKEVTDMFLPWLSGQHGRLILTGAAMPPGIAGKTEQMEQGRSAREETGVRITEQRACLTGMSYGLSSVYGYLNLSLD